MRRGARTLGVAALVAAFVVAPLLGQGPAIEVTLQGAAATGEVEFGVPFELRVERRWPTAGPEPEPWRDEALAPLHVETRSVQRDEQDGLVRERRELRAFAFRRGAVTLQPEIVLPAANTGAEPRRATAELRTILVDSSLPEDDDGSAELPEPLPFAIRPMRRELFAAAIAGALAALATALLAFAVRRHRARAALPPPPAEVLRRRLAAMREELPATRAARRAEAVALTAIARARLQNGVAAGERAALEASLQRLDAVKFAADELAADERERLYAELQRLLTATREDGAR